MEAVGDLTAEARRASLRELRLRGGQRALEAGCGTGIAVAELAGLVGPAGRVVAVDLDQKMVEATRRRAAACSNVDVRLGDVTRLGFPPGAFHAARIERVLEHLSPPRARSALAELVRVVRPGGRVAVVEPHHTQSALDGLPPTRALLARCASELANPDAGLVARSLLIETGCDDVTLSVFPVVCTTAASFRALVRVERLIEAAVAAGMIDRAEARAALADIVSRDVAGRFLAVVVFYVVAGTVPS